MRILIPKKKKGEKTKHYFYIEKENKFYGLSRLGGTFDWQVIKGKYFKHHIFQISFKKPWWKPKGDFVNDDTWRLYGWLFFYIGWSLEIENDEEYENITKSTYMNRITLKDHYNRYDKTYFIVSTIIEILLFMPPCYILFNYNCDVATTMWLSIIVAVTSNLYISRLIRED